MLICGHKSALSCAQAKRDPCGGAFYSESVMRFRLCQTCFSCSAATRMRTQMGLEYAYKLLLQYKVHRCTQIQQHKSSFEYGVGAFLILINRIASTSSLCLSAKTNFFFVVNYPVQKYRTRTNCNYALQISFPR